MRGICVISLISFYMLALFVNNNGITEGHSVKDYLRGLYALKQVKNLRHGILPGNFFYLLISINCSKNINFFSIHDKYLIAYISFYLLKQA